MAKDTVVERIIRLLANTHEQYNGLESREIANRLNLTYGHAKNELDRLYAKGRVKRRKLPRSRAYKWSLRPDDPALTKPYSSVDEYIADTAERSEAKPFTDNDVFIFLRRFSNSQWQPKMSEPHIAARFPRHIATLCSNPEDADLEDSRLQLSDYIDLIRTTLSVLEGALSAEPVTATRDIKGTAQEVFDLHPLKPLDE